MLQLTVVQVLVPCFHKLLGYVTQPHIFALLVQQTALGIRMRTFRCAVFKLTSVLLRSSWRTNHLSIEHSRSR